MIFIINHEYSFEIMNLCTPNKARSAAGLEGRVFP